MRTWRTWPRHLAIVAASLATWELLSRLGPWQPGLFPGPLPVAERLVHLAADGQLAADGGRSLLRLARGYALSVAAGVPLGIAMARSPTLGGALRPVVLGLQAMPSICWLPLAVLWFGLSEPAILFVVVMGSVVGIAIATEDAVAGVDPVLLRAAGSLGIRGLRLHAGVLLPAALPGIVTGLKLGWSFAWRALMSGELVFAAGGIGQLLQAARAERDAARLLALMAVIVAIGVAVDRGVFRIVEVRVRRRWGFAESAIVAP